MASNRRLAIGALLLALAFAQSAAAEGRLAWFSADLAFEAIQVPGSVEVHADSYLVGFSFGGAQPVGAGWDFQAERVHIVRENQHGLVVVLAPTPDMNRSPQTYDLLNVSGSTTLENDNVYWAAYAAGGPSTFEVGTQWSDPVLSAVDHAHFDGSNNDRGGVPRSPQLPPNPLVSQISSTFYAYNYPVLDVPGAALQATDVSQAAPLVLKGDFTVFNYGFDFHVAAAGGRSYDIESSYHRENIVGNPLNITTVARSDNSHTTIQFTNATLTLRTGQTPYTLSARHVTLGTSGNAVTLADAKGTAVVGKQIPVDTGSMSIALDPGRIDLWPSGSGLTTPFAGHFEGTLASLSMDGRQIPVPATTATAPASSSASWLWWLSALPLVAAGVTIPVVRRRRNDVETLLMGAEAAVAGGRFNEGLRMARRAVRQAPEDIDALVLRCVARLKLGDAATARVEVQQALNGPRPSTDPGTLHLMEGLCWLAEGNQSASEKAVAQALAVRPDLGGEVRNSAVFQRLRDSPLLRATWNEELPGGYG